VVVDMENLTTNESSLKWLVGLRVNLAMTGSDGRPRFESGIVCDVDEKFIYLRGNDGNFQLVALGNVSKIELPNSGRQLTPDRPPWKVAGGV